MLFPSFKSLPLLEKVFIFSIVISSGTAIGADSSLPALLMLLSFVLLFITKKIIVSKENIKIPIVCFCFAVLWVMLSFKYSSSPDTIGVIIKYVVKFVLILLLCSYRPEKNSVRFKFFLYVTLSLSIISTLVFIAYILGFPLPVAETKVHQISTIMYLDNFAMSPLYGIGGYRNSGIYWEPGMNQIYASMLLIYGLYSNATKMKKFILCGFSILVILTTGSVTGYVLAIVIMAINVLFGRTRRIFKIFLILSFIAIFIVILPYMIEMINNKMTIGTSASLRFFDIVEGFQVFKQRPILGHGIVNDAYFNASAAFLDEQRGNSNGFMNLLINFGLLGLVFYSLTLLSFFKWLTTKIFFKGKELLLTLIIWIIFSINNEPIATHESVIFFIGLGLSANKTLTNTFRNENRISCVRYNA